MHHACVIAALHINSVTLVDKTCHTYSTFHRQKCFHFGCDFDFHLWIISMASPSQGLIPDEDLLNLTALFSTISETSNKECLYWCSIPQKSFRDLHDNATVWVSEILLRPLKKLVKKPFSTYSLAHGRPTTYEETLCWFLLNFFNPPYVSI